MAENWEADDDLIKEVKLQQNVNDIQALKRVDSLPSKLLKAQYKTYQYSIYLSFSNKLCMYSVSSLTYPNLFPRIHILTYKAFC